jgi:hypothetical protein
VGQQPLGSGAISCSPRLMLSIAREVHIMRRGKTQEPPRTSSSLALVRLYIEPPCRDHVQASAGVAQSTPSGTSLGLGDRGGPSL